MAVEEKSAPVLVVRDALRADEAVDARGRAGQELGRAGHVEEAVRFGLVVFGEDGGDASGEGLDEAGRQLDRRASLPVTGLERSGGKPRHPLASLSSTGFRMCQRSIGLPPVETASTLMWPTSMRTSRAMLGDDIAWIVPGGPVAPS
jgi:hypothetical protein